jgi:hypothetical protein
MVTAMGGMMLIMMTSAAALGAATADIPVAREDLDRKRAYAAAEAGIADYFYKLNGDNAYWTKCTNVPEPHAVNQPWNGSGGDPRRWRQVPNSDAQYTIELMPKNGFSQCSTSQSQQSMIDATTGTFSIRATGRSRGEKRSIVATLRRRGFLDFLYFTDIETTDPTWYEMTAGGDPTNPDLVSWASTHCSKWWRLGRGSELYNGRIYRSGSWQNFSTRCTEIQFIDQDVVAGPLHTNDGLLTSGSPDFGRSRADAIEVSAPPRGWRSSGSGQPNFIGTWTESSPVMALPPSDAALASVAEPTYTFTGRTTIRLNGSTMTVNGSTTMPLPSNGVVYVHNGACGQGYQPLDPYGNAPGCADVYVSGNYSGNLTIGTEKDIIVDGDVTRSGDVMLGLIANNFVRVYHPVTRSSSDRTSCTNAPGTMNDVEIDAAILSLQHSFTVDNYYCGARLGNLTVTGAIGQKYRGPVGRSGSGGGNGYTKRYSYDDRLRFRSPPHFLDPVQSAWRVIRQSEQAPAR